MGDPAVAEAVVALVILREDALDYGDEIILDLRNHVGKENRPDRQLTQEIGPLQALAHRRMLVTLCEHTQVDRSLRDKEPRQLAVRECCLRICGIEASGSRSARRVCQ